MDVRFTSSARSQLLEAVVRLRDRDRDRAAALLDGVEDRLRAVAESPEDGAPAEGVATAVAAGDEVGLRLFYRTRRDVLWVLAVWSDDDRTEPVPAL